MKKTIWLVLIVIVLCVCSLSACDNTNIPNGGASTGTNQTPTENSHTHSFDEWEIVKVATCTTDGLQERYCSCGEKQTKTIAKGNHNFSEWHIIKNATCTTNGTEEKTCSCGYSEKRSISKISCNEVNGICSMCSKTINPFNALKHYVVTNGSQLSSGYEYLYTDRTYTDSRGYTTYIEYNANDNEFTIGILIEMSGNMSIYTTNVIEIGKTTQKLQMQYREDGRYHYCSANITTSFCDSNNGMTSCVYRGEAPSLQDDMFDLLNQSTLIMLSAVNETVKSLNLDISLSDFGYYYYY